MTPGHTLASLVSLLFCSSMAACEAPQPVVPQPPAPPLPALPTAGDPGPAAPLPPVVDVDFLHRYVESRHFTRGAPQQSMITPDGRSVLFLRATPDSASQSLFEMDIATGAVREITTPQMLDSGPEHLTDEERARRERMRITARGFTAFALTSDGKTLLVTLSGKLYAVDRAGGKGRVLETGRGAVIDPELSPDGKLVAYVLSDDVFVTSVDGGGKPRAITRGGTEDHPHGLADFAAAEELDRQRGFWWSPDSRSILYEDSDATQVERVTIADPSHPENPGTRVPYPRAGKKNALLRFGFTSVVAPGHTTWVEWDREAMPYAASVSWHKGAPPTLIVLDRLQKNESLLVADPKTGKTREAMHDHDDAWVNAGGSGTRRGCSDARWLPDGSGFLWWSERDGDGRLGLVLANDPASVKWLTPSGTQVTALLDLDPARRVAIVETTRDALRYEVDKVSLDGGPLTPIARLDDGAIRAGFSEPHDLFLGREGSLSGANRLVVRSTAGAVVREVPSIATVAASVPIELEEVGPERTHVALVRPHKLAPGARYPLIDAAYGGPHAQVVSIDSRGYAFAQWMADATGAFVVAIDAQGTPGRGRAWERAIAGKLGDVPLDGHIAAIHELTKKHPEIDEHRVGVYGWSFGGYFAALAALRHPEVFSAAVAIAPVTDWRNYDTAYTERYLGLPDVSAAAYDAASVLLAAQRPLPAHPPALLLAHGTADDNVYFFHSLDLADALAKAGRPFSFLPMSGQTHQVASPESQAAIWVAAARTLREGLAKRQ